MMELSLPRLGRPHLVMSVMAITLAACGGGGSGSTAVAADTVTDGSTSVGSSPAAAAPLVLSACQASGKGTDYQVGPNSGQLSSLEQVPWESLKAGDTVRIFYRSTPYAGKFLIAAQGTTDAPVRICGVKGSNGERPVITGANAVTRTALSSAYGNTASTSDTHQTRSVIVVKPLATQAYEAYPRNIQIDGLQIRSAHPNYQFTDASGTRKSYVDFGACVWVERGHNITIADNEITDCSQGIFSRSTGDDDFTITKNLRIAGNTFTNNGIVGDNHEHSTYIQSHGVIYEFNRYGPMRSGTEGSSLKDRSVGAVVRYNRIEDGARAIDLVEAEDYPTYAVKQAAYRSTFVYGNQFKKNGDDGSFFHYGGDHFGAAAGANWGETLFRRGTLYFFNNTVHGTGTNVRLFQISTTLETVEAWNNVFWFDASVTSLNLRQAENDSLSTSYTPDGILNLGVNWIRSDWTDTTAWKTLKGQVNGTANLLTGSSAPFDTSSFVPNASSAIIDAGKAGPSAASAYGVNYQLDSSYAPVARTVKGAAIDLGATER